MKKIFQGAEAKIYLLEGKYENGEYLFNISSNALSEILNDDIKEDLVLKYSKRFLILKARYRKKYRNEFIDKKLRKYRTRREAKILLKLKEKINIPELIYYDEDKGVLVMEFIEGERLSDILEERDYKSILYKAGEIIGIIHKNRIFHGDATTSNFILKDDELYLIDFGLSTFSTRIEDYAVDLHLFKESFFSRHWKIVDSFNYFLEGYKNSLRNLFEKVIRRLEDIEKRGRYKKII